MTVALSIYTLIGGVMAVKLHDIYRLSWTRCAILGLFWLPISVAAIVAWGEQQ